MGRQLMIEYPSFLANIQSMDKILQTLRNDAPLWSLEGQLGNSQLSVDPGLTMV